MSESSIKWLFFDLDETLVDFRSASKTSFFRSFEAKGIEAEEEWYSSIYAKINRRIWDEFEQNKINAVELRTKRFKLLFESIEVSLDPIDFNQLYAKYIIEETKVLPGAYTRLEELSQEYQLAIITNGLKEFQRPRLQRLDLNKYFKVIIVSDEIGHSKPNRAFFDQAIEAAGNPAKSEILIIGDGLSSDIRGGMQNQIKTCWYNPAELHLPKEYSPTHVINDLKDLNSILNHYKN